MWLPVYCRNQWLQMVKKVTVSEVAIQSEKQIGNHPALSAGEKRMLPGDRLDFLLYFPDGQTEGDVHVQALQRDKIGYGSMAPFSPAVSFVFQPAGIEVEGDMVVTIALPDDLESTEHWAEMPPLVLLLGLDPNALELVPVGVP